MRLFTCVLAVAVTTLVSGCATVPTDPEDRAEYEALNDPLEPTNRTVMDFNLALDDAVLRPVARGYRSGLPDEVQHGIHNVLNNLRSPLIFANDTLQGSPNRAGDTLIRFMINSTMGVFGIFDVVGDTGGPRYHGEDFGQTLAVWGVGEGPYLVLPFFGPSNPRDTVGLGVEFLADPADLALVNQSLEWAVWTRTGVGVGDERAELLDPIDDLKRNSLDFYAAVRSIYRQRRANEIANRDMKASDLYKKESH
ncbi:MAG TPA: VacJ family lipoprotein [Magnetospirillum sp.]|jgi:phospholipid-binding lipoprotein MlaA|nr:VacJ family lipoprotein [Magnetospirillum sp.]